MLRRIAVLGSISLALYGCGGSKHSSTTSTSSSSTPSSAAASSTSTAAGSGSTSSTTAGKKAPHSSQKKSSQPNGGSTNARVPATFKILLGDHLRPRAVRAPAFLAVRLTVISTNAFRHHVTMRAPHVSLTVPPSGRASVLLPGMRAGLHLLYVDGLPHGALLIGGQPGP